MNKDEKKIIAAYRKHWHGAFEVLNGPLTDEEAQKAIRGINASYEDFSIMAKKDIKNFLDYFNANKFKFKEGEKPRALKLQIKVECDYTYRSYLIYLNFV